MTDLTLPSAIEVERFVLGSVLTRANLMDDLRSTLLDGDFHLEAHRRIWRRSCEVYDAGSGVGIVSVGAALDAAKERESIGGYAYLAELIEGVPSVPIDPYVSILKDRTMRRRIVLEAHKLSLMASDEQMPLEALLGLAGALASNVAWGEGNGHGLVSTADMIASEGIDRILGPREHHRGVRLPWAKLQAALEGFAPSQMIVLLGETGKGKTSLALQCALHAALQGAGVLVWTMEMSPRANFRRLVAQLSGTALSGRPGQLTFDERRGHQEAVACLNDHPIWFDRSSRSVAAFGASVRKVRAKCRLGLVIVDYLQLIGAHSRVGNRAQEVGENSRNLKLMAMDFDIPVLVLSQVDRSSVKGGGKIGLHSAKESGDCENDADVLMWIDAPEFERSEETPVKIHVGKQREGPAGFFIPAVFRPTSQTFVEAE